MNLRYTGLLICWVSIFKNTCTKVFMPVLSTSDLRLEGASSLLALKTKPPRISSVFLGPPVTLPTADAPDDPTASGMVASTPLSWFREETELPILFSSLLEEANPNGALVRTPYP